MSDAKLVKKILRPLPQSFKIKVTTSDEVHDTLKMKVDELIDSLLTYEMPLEVNQYEKKPKGLTFKAATSDSLNLKEMRYGNEGLNL